MFFTFSCEIKSIWDVFEVHDWLVTHLLVIKSDWPFFVTENRILKFRLDCLFLPLYLPYFDSLNHSIPHSISLSLASLSHHSSLFFTIYYWLLSCVLTSLSHVWSHHYSIYMSFLPPFLLSASLSILPSRKTYICPLLLSFQTSFHPSSFSFSL